MTPEETAQALLDRHGRTFCDELGIDIDKGTPSPLYEWSVACSLFAKPIGHDLAISGAKALFDAGYTTPNHMAESKWEDRVKALNKAGYARFDESMAAQIGDAAAFIEDEYSGDLRKLREAAEHDPEEERKRLKAIKGIGDTGVDIFFREVQAVWDEIYPYADETALKAADTFGLGKTADKLSGLVLQKDFPRLVAALTRASLADEGPADLEAA